MSQLSEMFIVQSKSRVIYGRYVMISEIHTDLTLKFSTIEMNSKNILQNAANFQFFGKNFSIRSLIVSFRGFHEKFHAEKSHGFQKKL